MDLDRLRAEADRHTADLVLSLFQNQFGHPLSNSLGWPVAELRELGNVVTGTTPPSALNGMFEGDIPFVTPGDLERDTRQTARFVTDAGAAESRIVRAGSTLVCCIGATIGKTDRTWKTSAFNQQINAIEWNERIDDDFGWACMRLCKSEIIRQSKSTALPILKKSLFERVQIPVPPIFLQRAFANQVSEIRALEAGQTASRSRLDDLFQSLLYRAFQGEL
jgi:type I restriction enzyme S subunit